MRHGQIEDEFGTQNALDYLIGEKFLNFLEAAETDAEFRAEIPAFVAEIKTIFEPWQLAEYLETARQSEPFDPSLYELWMRRTRISTLKSSKMSDRMSFAVRLPISCSLNVPGSGSWKTYEP